MSTNEVLYADTSHFITVGSYAMDPTKWDLVDNDEVKGGGREAIYQRNDTDPQRPVTLRIGVYPVSPGSDGIPSYNVSLKMTYWNKFTDDDAEVHYDTGHIVLAVHTKRQPMLGEPDNMMDAIFNLVSFLWGSLNVGTADFSGIDKLTRGLTDLKLGDITRA